jgi:hypothetical protein
MYRKIQTPALATAVILNTTAFAAGPAGGNPLAEGVRPPPGPGNGSEQDSPVGSSTWCRSLT